MGMGIVSLFISEYVDVVVTAVASFYVCQNHKKYDIFRIGVVSQQIRSVISVFNLKTKNEEAKAEQLTKLCTMLKFCVKECTHNDQDHWRCKSQPKLTHRDTNTQVS